MLYCDRYLGKFKFDCKDESAERPRCTSQAGRDTLFPKIFRVFRAKLTGNSLEHRPKIEKMFMFLSHISIKLALFET